ncbi:hypothetical protein ACHAW6_006866 [Cyclotella cf. meneghiniana]
MTPFDNAVHGTQEDNYNFFHSSSSIWVECGFGEIDLRWGILWKRLSQNVSIIDECMRLHNFIIDWREGKQFKSSTEVDVGLNVRKTLQWYCCEELSSSTVQLVLTRKQQSARPIRTVSYMIT